ncbi:MAG TPA: flagellar hook-length control protein FliK [Verrucomicrobiae bacterium]|nr:flagellar hook-length control protein FliK [Verrucomicrobiae bacterium]
MIPLQVADAAVFSAPQGIAAETMCPQGAADFLSLFEQMIGSGVAAQVADETVPGGPIGALDVLTGEKRLPACRSSSDGSSEKGQAERNIDPAAAILVAIFSGSTQSAVLEPSAGCDYIADLLPSDMAAAPAAVTFLEVSTQPLFTREAGSMLESADIHAVDSVGVAISVDSTRLLSVEIDPHLKPAVSSQETGATLVTSGPSLRPQGLSIMTLPADAETHTAYGDGLLMSMQVRTTLPPFSLQVSSWRGEGQSEGDLRGHDPHLAEQPTEPARGVQEVVRIERFEARSDVDRVADLTAPAPAVVLSYAPSTEGTGLTPPRPPGAPAATTTSRRSVFLEGDAATYPKTDISEESTIVSAIPEMVSPSPDTGLSAREVWTEPSGTVQQPPAVPQGSSQTSKPDAARPTLVMPLVNNERSAIGNQQSAGGGVNIPATSAKEVQDGINRLNDAQAPGQVGGLLPIATLLGDSAKVTVALSEEAAGRSSFPQRPAVRITISSGVSEALGSEARDSEGFRDQTQVNADDDRAALRQESPRIETTQWLKQDESASDSESGSSAPDRSSSPSSDRPGLHADCTLSAASRTEGLRSGPVVPFWHPRTLSDQLAEPIVMAARLSQRNEGKHVQLRLHPQTLGELVIEVSWKDSGIVAAIKVQHHVAGELLTNDLGRLRIALVEQGIPISDLGVQVGLDLHQWSYAGNGSQDSHAIGYLPEVMLQHDQGSIPPMIPVMGSDSLIDITV